MSPMRPLPHLWLTLDNENKQFTCAKAMLIFSVSLHFFRMISMEYPG